MRILMVHQNFPGQYKHLAPALAARPQTEVVALAMNETPAIPGVRVVRYGVERGTSQHIHPWAADFETKLIRGEAAARAAQRLRTEGFVPDIICAHPGWGEALFLKDVWPEARLLSFLEFYYHGRGADVGFDPEFPDNDLDALCRVRSKNANTLLSLEASDWAVSPTHWQRSTAPACFRERISVIFDGIDTDAVRPNPSASITLNNALTLTGADEVISFINRNLEPYRGVHVFMRALPDILARRPRARVIIVGGDQVSYGKAPADGRTWRQTLLEEVGPRLDLSRVHFVGHVPYPTFVALMQVSAVHIYLTYPFVLSWSVLEAMSAGALVIGSATPPVEEMIHDGETGLLVDFFDTAGLARRVSEVLDHPDRMASLRGGARQAVVEHYDLRRVCLPQQLALVGQVAAGKLPRRP
jgi:glycosyltransferase involved in cell wall biosynthesis